MRKYVFLLLALLLTTPLYAQSVGMFVSDDCSAYKPNTSVPAEPAKWGSYVDPVFGTTIRKVTDWVADGLAARPTSQYSTYTNVNADGTVYYVSVGNSRNGYFYDSSDGTLLRSLTVGNPGTQSDMEWRWDATDPDVGFYHQLNVWYEYNYVTDTSTEMRDFGDDFAEWGWDAPRLVEFFDKGEPSWDSRYFPMRARRDCCDFWPQSTSENRAKYFIIYDRVLDKVARLDLDAMLEYLGWAPGSVAMPRFVGSMPTSRWAYIRMASDISRGFVIENPLYGGAGTDGMLIPFANCRMAPADGSWAAGHMTTAIDMDGDDVYVVRINGYEGVKMKDGTRTQYLPSENPNNWPDYLGCGSFTGVSVRNYHMSHIQGVPGWAIFSYYGEVSTWVADSDPGYPLNGEIWAVELTDHNPRILRLAHTRSNNWGEGWYNCQSRTQVSPDGKHIYFDSNWFEPSSGDDNANELYRIELPDGFWEEIDTRRKSVRGADLSAGGAIQ